MKNDLGNHLKNRFAELFEMPKDVVLDQPKIFMIGNSVLSLENHRGIIEYSQQLIRVRISKGQVLISGEDLTIKRLNKERVKVAGQLINIKFEYY